MKSDTNVFPCTFCGNTFTSAHILKQHKCQACRKCFSQLSDLTAHFKTVHEGKNDYKCGTCGKEFNQISDLTRHINSVH